MWFGKLVRSFFFFIDDNVFSFISKIYDLLITISRTTILSHADINQFYQKIYALLGIFMLFKVGFSLITYVVNPDDFSDKNKGIGKIGQNAIISLCMLVLVPYAFSMAYELQSIILEDNILANIIFGDENNKQGSNSYLNNAGDQMAFTILNAFVTPNTSLKNARNCTKVYGNGLDNNKEPKLNRECLGMGWINGQAQKIDDPSNTLYAYTETYIKEAGSSVESDLTETDLANYVSGLKKQNLGLMFRLNLLKSTVEKDEYVDDEVWLMNYSWPFSTVVGVVTLLMLIGFCFDVALRSVKLAFLQLIAPIPIISFVDPKSGKDGIFKKWYKMCFSTFLSLFVRLAALYFGIYIITKVSGMTDIVTGATVTNGFVQIFIIIGVLMFAKQLPKILEGLGIKIDGDGKFNLNPLKKIEDGTFGGKRLTGAAAGFAVGALGNKGNPFRAIGGAFRGAAGNQGLSGAAKHQANVNKQLRQAKLDGSTIGGRMNARWQNATGAKGFNNVEKDRKQIDALKSTSDAMASMENRAVEKIQSGEAGDLSKKYLSMKAETERLQEAYSNGDSSVSADMVAESQMNLNKYLNEDAKYAYMDAMIHGKEVKDKNGNTSISYVDKDGNEQKISGMGIDKTFKSKEAEWRSKSSETSGVSTPEYGKEIHGEMGRQKGEITKLDNETRAKSASNQADQKYVEAAKIKK